MSRLLECGVKLKTKNVWKVLPRGKQGMSPITMEVQQELLTFASVDLAFLRAQFYIKEAKTSHKKDIYAGGRVQGEFRLRVGLAHP